MDGVMAFYVQDRDAFVSTELTRGPWSNDHQHAGPPSALLARALERVDDPAGELFLARITIELFKPIPIAPLTIAARVSRAGKTVERVEAALSAGGVELARASGVRIRRRAVSLPEDVSTAGPVIPGPDDCTPLKFSFFQHEVGYHLAIEGRIARGVWGDRDIVTWSRPVVALVEGEELRPAERVLIIADAESGICPPLDPMRYTFLNPDLTVYFERPLEGEWLGLATRSAAHAHGVGIAESLLFDARGALGRSAQSLIVAPRA
ncbi:MAG: thioesterase family protein [Polyangiaceae bacterium]